MLTFNVKMLTGTCVSVIFSKNPPQILEYFMLRVAGWFSGMHTQMEFSSGMCIRGALGVNTVESGGKKLGKAEGRIKLDYWPDNLS